MPIEDLSEELFHFYFTLRILRLFNLNMNAKYVNKAVDTAVTTAVCSSQTLFRKKSITWFKCCNFIGKMQLCLFTIVQDETLKKSQSLAFRVNSDFSTVITSLDDA